jgi:hypothetical protein
MPTISIPCCLYDLLFGSRPKAYMAGQEDKNICADEDKSNICTDTGASIFVTGSPAMFTLRNQKTKKVNS